MQLGTAVIRYGEEGDLAAALLKQHVPGAELQLDSRQGAGVDLVIGILGAGLGYAWKKGVLQWHKY